MGCSLKVLCRRVVQDGVKEKDHIAPGRRQWCEAPTSCRHPSSPAASAGCPAGSLRHFKNLQSASLRLTSIRSEERANSSAGQARAAAPRIGSTPGGPERQQTQILDNSPWLGSVPVKPMSSSTIVGSIGRSTCGRQHSALRGFRELSYQREVGASLVKSSDKLDSCAARLPDHGSQHSSCMGVLHHERAPAACTRAAAAACLPLSAAQSAQGRSRAGCRLSPKWHPNGICAKNWCGRATSSSANLLPLVRDVLVSECRPRLLHRQCRRCCQRAAQHRVCSALRPPRGCCAAPKGAAGQ